MFPQQYSMHCGLFRLPSGPSRDNVGGCNTRFSPLFSPPLGAEKGAATAACILQKLSDPILFRFPPPPKEQACVCVVGYRSPPHSSNLPPTLLSAWAPAAAAAQIKRPPNMGRKREDKDLLLFDRLLLLLLLSSRVVPPMGHRGLSPSHVRFARLRPSGNMLSAEQAAIEAGRK